MLRGGDSVLTSEGDGDSVIWVAIKEGGHVTGALSIQAARTNAYEDSTVTFMEQVADQVALALRNAWSYASSEAQRRRLEVVNAVGRRLASSLDRWSIMGTLREELARYVTFDGFILATVHPTPDGPVAQGYQYVGGLEEEFPPVALGLAGPSQEAYNSRRPVLIKRNPWRRSLEALGGSRRWVVAGGAAAFISDQGEGVPMVSRSLVWVPVLHGDEVSALLSLQSYTRDAFGQEVVQLLEGIAAHVSLALANADHFAAAQTERRRLEALHLIEMGVAGSATERQIAESVIEASVKYVECDLFALCALDSEGQLGGFKFERGQGVARLEPVPIEKTTYFRRLVVDGATIVDEPKLNRRGWPSATWTTTDRRLPKAVIWVPVVQDGRVVAALTAQRFDDDPFGAEDIQLIESAAPLVGIALRTVRLHRANELALAHSVRIQEVAALAGHDLASVIASVADQARAMIDARGVTCWVFDAEGRTSAHRSSGDLNAEHVLAWATRQEEAAGKTGGKGPVVGLHRGTGWQLIPLWYADRLVGALGSVHATERGEQPSVAAIDFARHAAIAIENARLVAETRGRIHALEAVAGFTDLDPTRPARTRAEMAGLVERALESAGGSLWLLGPGGLIRPSGAEPSALPGSDFSWLAEQLHGDTVGRRQRDLLTSASPDSAEPGAVQIQVAGRLVGILVADLAGPSRAETRRLMSVLAGQVGVVLGRLDLVEALDRERLQMNTILSHSPDGVTLESAAGTIIFANPAAERLYGIDADTMMGLTLDAMLATAAATPSAIPEGEESDANEYRLDGSDVIVRVRAVPIPSLDGEPAGVLCLHEDVTQERQVMEAKDLMLRAIGHEVRSPAAAMKSTLAGLLQWESRMEPEQRSELIGEAYEMSDRLLQLVENQLIIAKLETSRFQPNPGAIAVDDSLRQVIAVLSHRYGDRVAAVEVNLPTDLPPAYCEPTHLNQVLTNLIGNALEYTTSPIYVTATQSVGWLNITVSDTGPGLPVDRIESLFQKTAPAGRNRARGGLGLGLYLCHLVVERSFGGNIWLSSTSKRGTAFEFTVPSATDLSSYSQQPAVG
ncbi:MAG TPA: GAF domain-containing protein [Candidatus Dormibacteraeota bacterium]|nr:GAF domain-containing protein [Candidatus Dormibacteraeota bacterium]